MINLGGTIFGIGLLSYLLPLLGMQFTLVTMIELGGYSGGLVCIMSGIGLILIGTVIKVANGPASINTDNVKIDLSDLNEEEALKFIASYLIHTSADEASIFTAKKLFEKTYMKELSDERLITVINNHESWLSNFIEKLQSNNYAKEITQDSAVSIIKLIYCISCADAELSQKEKEFLTFLAESLKLDNETFSQTLNETTSSLRAA